MIKYKNKLREKIKNYVTKYVHVQTFILNKVYNKNIQQVVLDPYYNLFFNKK